VKAQGDMSSGFGATYDFLTSLSLVSQIFIVGILAIWVMFNLRYSRKVVELGPTILTTLGIFGTFLGVAIGLAHFDTSNVQASVPALLSGLKTAFWASVFGVGAAVQIKGREFLFGNGEKAGTGDQATPLSVLVDIREAIGGYGENAMAQQLRLVRQDLNDRLLAQIRMARQDTNERMEAFRTGQMDVVARIDNMAIAQTEALRSLAAMGSQTLVDSLQHVVTGFNDKVASQFGENYRELGQAVGQMLAWQNDYRDTIKSMTGELAETLRLLGYAAGDFRAVTQGSERFAQTAERVARTLDGIEAGESRIADVTRGLVKLTEEAAGRVPYIEARLLELTSQMTNSVQSNQKSLSAALTGSAASLRDAMDSSQASFADIARASAAQLQENQAAIAAALTDNAAAMTQALHATQRNLLAAIAGFDEDTTNLIGMTKDRVVKLDHAMATNLTHSIEKLAAQLSTQMDAAGARVAAHAAKPRLQIVADAGGDD
jgi:hypothetical protein